MHRHALPILSGAIFFLCLVGLTGGDRPVRADPPGGDGAWRQADVWDDGKAEFSVYEVTWARYGRKYEGRAMLVAVKEPWAPDLDVKADRPRPDGFDVLKLNHIRDVATGIYTYHQMASAYVRRDDGRLRKLAAMSSEACGLSTADLRDGALATRSYFDGQGDRRQEWPEGAVPEDALPLMLRDYLRGPAPAELQVFPTLMAGRFPPLAPRTYALERAEASLVVEVPAGRFDALRLTLEHDADRMVFDFAAAPPHELLHHERADGTVYRLARSERIPYWGLNRPGDESWLPEGLR